MWTLSGLAALTLIVYIIIPIARAIKNMGRRHDAAEILYPGDPARQSDFRDEVTSGILRSNPGLNYDSPEFEALYRREMDRILEEYRRRPGEHRLSPGARHHESD